MQVQQSSEGRWAGYPHRPENHHSRKPLQSTDQPDELLGRIIVVTNEEEAITAVREGAQHIEIQSHLDLRPPLDAVMHEIPAEAQVYDAQCMFASYDVGH